MREDRRDVVICLVVRAEFDLCVHKVLRRYLRAGEIRLREADATLIVDDQVAVRGQCRQIAREEIGEGILHRTARVDGDVIVLFGSLRREPGSRIHGSQYVVGRGVVSWIPGAGWVEAIVVVLLILAALGGAAPSQRQNHAPVRLAGWSWDDSAVDSA